MQRPSWLSTNYVVRSEIPEGTYRASFDFLGMVLPVAGIIRGGLIVVSDGEWAGRSLDMLMSLFPHAPVVLGLLLLLASTLLLSFTLSDTPRGVFFAAWACGLWSMIAAVAATVSSFQGAGAPIDLSGATSWAFFAIAFVVQAQIRVQR